MQLKARAFLTFSVLIVAGLYFLIAGLAAAQSFLAPLLVAILLSMVLLSLCRKLERWGIHRGWSSFLAVLVTLALVVGLAFVVAGQVHAVAEDWPQIRKRVEPRLEQLQQFISEKTGMVPSEQDQLIQKQLGTGRNKSDDSKGEGQASPSSGKSSSGSSWMSSLGNILLGFFNFTGTALLTGIYIFFILLYRSKLRKSVLRFVSGNNREKAERILQASVNISNNYLLGRSLLIIILIVLYALGLSLSGVSHAVLISILAAVLSLLPYIGNIVGFFLALAMAAVSAPGIMGYAGVMITFGVAQFVESYILEPYVVGKRVELNPLMTILVVVLGGAVWGIVGMIISIPFFGMIKIICDQIRELEPIGYLLGEDDIEVMQDEHLLERLVRKVRERKDE